jgi:tetratricopeptide (TPR) repeat protein
MLSSVINRGRNLLISAGNIIANPRFGSLVLVLLCFVALFVSSRMQWIFMPLSHGLKGFEVGVAFLPGSIFGFSVLWLLLATVGLWLLGKKIQWLLFLPFLLSFCWPLVGAGEFAEYLPQYFQESRDRSIMTELFRNQEIGNVNLQPKYFPYFDVQTPWQNLQASYQILDGGWYLFVLIAFILPFMLSRLALKAPVTSGTMAAVVMATILASSSYFWKDNMSFSVALNDAKGFPKMLELCERRLAAAPHLAQSDYFIGRCSEAYSAFTGWRGPVAKIPELYSQFGDRNFLRLPQERSEEFEQYLTALRLMPAQSSLEQAFTRFGERHYNTLVSVQAIGLVNDGQLTLASSRLAGLESKGVAANMLVGFIATRMGQPEISLQAYNEAIAQIGNTSMQANSYCSLGDAMVVAGEMEAAREYFQQCRDLDGELNYWAVAGLGG